MTKRTGRICRPMVEGLEGRELMTAGVLDPTFGGGTGIVINQVGAGGDGGLAVAVYPPNDPSGNAGKIVEVGYAGSGTPTAIAVARYNPDGTPDTTFGKGGQVLSAISQQSCGANAVAIQADGKIVVGGYANVNNTTEDYALVRYNTNGSLDTTFGSGGIVMVSFPVSAPKRYTTDSDSVINSLVIQPWDGRIVIAGGVQQTIVNLSTTRSSFLARYNTNGTLDATFGSGGTVLTSPTSQGQNFHYVGLQSVGGVNRIIAFQNGLGNPGVVRYNLNGTVDTSFGVNGLAPISSGVMLTQFGAIGPDGKILVAGSWQLNSSGGFGLMRLNANGSMDTTLNGSGEVAYVNPYSQDQPQPWSVVAQPDGAIILGGSFPVPIPNSSPLMYTSDFGLVRYTPTGQLDPTFGASGTGVVDTPIGNPSHAAVHALALQPDGAIVAASNTSGGTGFLLARYQGDPGATTTALTASPNPAPSGQPVTFTAAVVTVGPFVPTGTVDFYVDGLFLGAGTLSTSNGVTSASFTTSTLASGSHTVWAIYVGDDDDLGSISADLTQVVV